MVADSGPIEFGPADEVGLGGDGEKLHGGMNKHGKGEEVRWNKAHPGRGARRSAGSRRRKRLDDDDEFIS